jgi:hypothetical protein
MQKNLSRKKAQPRRHIAASAELLYDYIIIQGSKGQKAVVLAQKGF